MMQSILVRALSPCVTPAQAGAQGNLHVACVIPWIPAARE